MRKILNHHCGFILQVFCGGQQRHVNVGVRGRTLGQPDLLLSGWTQGRHRGLFLWEEQLGCEFLPLKLWSKDQSWDCDKHVHFSLRCQLYTVSQDGTLCVWESDTELDGLILKKSQVKPKPQRQGDEEEEGEGERIEGEEGEVIRGKTEAPKEKTTKNVRYKQKSK